METIMDRYDEYLNKINWNMEYKDNDVFPEVCPVCQKKVFIKFYGRYHESYVIRCESPDCMCMTFRGL